MAIDLATIPRSTSRGSWALRITVAFFALMIHAALNVSTSGVMTFLPINGSFWTQEEIDLPQHVWDEPQSKLPEWMKDYMRWHHQMRSRLSDPEAAGWNTTLGSTNNDDDDEEPIKFLVLQCLTLEKCGGLSDRLKPLPYILRIANYTERMLLIYWNRPGRVEEFLVPPRGGIDWRVPTWMVPEIERKGLVMRQRSKGLDLWSGVPQKLVRTRFQDSNGGQVAYDELLEEGEIDFAGVFHDVWRAFFTPSPPVREALESDMQRLGLVPGQYTAAHLRALYAVKDRPEEVQESWTRIALNCGSELRPQKTIFFASDSGNATDYARQYGAERNATVITRTPTPNPPAHLEKTKDWRTISDFYDTFIDLYILGQADCLTHNIGGYGRLGLFLSRNSSCGFLRPRNQAVCVWTDDPRNGTELTRANLPQNPMASHESIYLEPMDSYTFS